MAAPLMFNHSAQKHVTDSYLLLDLISFWGLLVLWIDYCIEATHQ